MTTTNIVNDSDFLQLNPWLGLRITGDLKILLCTIIIITLSRVNIDIVFMDYTLIWEAIFNRGVINSFDPIDINNIIQYSLMFNSIKKGPKVPSNSLSSTNSDFIFDSYFFTGLKLNFYIIRTYSTKQKVFVHFCWKLYWVIYSFQFSSLTECKKALGISRKTKLSLGSGAERTLGIARRSRASQAQPPIRRVIKEAQPESNFM
jgi:hypothetical protein